MVSLTRSLFQASKLRNWSATLQLPKSTFPYRASPEQLSRFREECADDVYLRQQERRSGRIQDGSKEADRELFILHDGPPYANGDLHIGHAVNKILKDIICRAQMREGKLVQYTPGWDCHGLPIELKALERWKKSGQGELSDPVAIRKIARELASDTVIKQAEGFKQWGVMGDFNHAWRTSDKGYELEQLKVFRTMVQAGLIVRRFKPVYWSPSTKTALAEAELEYKEDHESTAAFVRFPIKRFPSIFKDKNINIPNLSAAIWTTTPWTLPANKAIAVNKDLDYAVVYSERHGHLLIAESRRKYIEHMIEEQLDVITGEIPGAALVGSMSYTGLFQTDGKGLPVLSAGFVSSDSGTGLVHCAPGHGMDDYDLCRQFHIDAFAPVNDEGRFTENAMPENLSILLDKPVLTEGNAAVIAHLVGTGNLIRTHNYQHKYPYDWRSKTPVIVRATEQWFADLEPIRDQALDALKSVNFVPESGRSRLESFIKNRSEWCISRQRAWGVPIPALYHRETGEALLNDKVVSHVINEIRERGVDAWWSDDPDDFRWTPLDLRESENESKYIRRFDTMDVWFDSGTSWTQNKAALESLGRKRDDKPPADVYIEGTDQHRGWFQSSLLTYIAAQSDQQSSASAHHFSPPFQALITHGFTLDGEGKKMSKSIGNTILPREIIDGSLLMSGTDGSQKAGQKKGQSSSKSAKVDSLGPDLLRLWVASTDYMKDILVRRDTLKSIHGDLHKLRTTFKLLIGALRDFDPSRDIIPYESLSRIDRIALLQLSELLQTVSGAFRSFEFYKAVVAINRWVNVEFSSLYMESIKDRLYADGEASLSRRSSQTVLFHIYSWLQSMLSPITPFLVQESIEHAAETLQPSTRRDPFLDLPPMEPAWIDPSLMQDLPHLLAAKSAVNTAQEQARIVKQMGSSLQSAVHLTFPPGSEAYQRFKQYGDELEQLFVVSDVTLSEGNHNPLRSGTHPWGYSAEFDTHGGVTGTAYVYSASADKCARCWRYKVEPTAAPGVDAVREEKLCDRCEGVVNELDEHLGEGAIEVKDEGKAASG